jgi:hypothetical protein
MLRHALILGFLALFLAPSASAHQARPATELPPSDRIERTDLDAVALLRASGRDPRGGALVLHSGEHASLHLEAPFAARSLGMWWWGELGSAFATPCDAEGAALGHWPVIEDHDQAPHAPEDLRERPAGTARVSSLTHVYDERAASLRIDLFGPVRLEALTLVWIDVEDPKLSQPASSSYTGGYPKPFVYSRAFWNADAPQCGVSYCNVTHLAVHHTASPSDYGAATLGAVAGNVKATQAYHMYTNGWCDIGYNYLVSKQGWIFEGRAGGDNVKGAHDGKNCGSMGVASLGYFHTPYNDPPTGAQLDAYARLFAWKADQQGIDPFGTGFYAGLGAPEKNIYGHRDVSATACPGDLLYAQLGNLRQDVADELAGGGAGPTAGTLKGVLYDASKGTSFRIAGGTVALADGTFTVSAGDGYFEFPLAAGNYAIGATASGFSATSSSETVTTGDVWESLGLWPNSAVPLHSVTSTGATTFQGLFQGDPGTPVWLGYGAAPGLPIQSLPGLGPVWPELGSVQLLFLGHLPGSGVGAWNFNVTGVSPGQTLHTQGYLRWAGQWRLTSGAAWMAQ